MIADLLRRAGNKLYRPAFPAYRPLYRAFKAFSDRHTRRLLAGLLSPGHVVVDAGANIGIYSHFLANCVAPTGVVHSFEPDATNFLHLQEFLSQSPNIKLNQLAVGDKTGPGRLYLSARLNVDHRAYPTDEQNRITVPIDTIRLDDYFTAGTRVDLLKLDIQGYEEHALRGAERVLRDNVPIKLMLECWPMGLLQAGASASELLRLLHEHDFKVYEIRGNDLRPFSVIDSINRSKSYFDLFASRTTLT